MLVASGSNFNDWLELVVVILLIGGSALGSIAKTLISKFGGKASVKESPGARPNERSAALRQRQPMHPVARPMPQRRSEHGQATVRPYPLRPKAPAPSDRTDPPSVFRAEMPAMPSERVAKPAARIPTRPRPIPPQVDAAKPSSPAKHGPSEVRSSTSGPHKPLSIPQRPRPSRPTPARPAKRRAKVRTKAKPKEEDTRVGTLRDSHLKLSADLAHPHTEALKRVQGVAVDPIRRPTRQGLRHAIILNEILGPPIALRPPDDSF